MAPFTASTPYEDNQDRRVEPDQGRGRWMIFSTCAGVKAGSAMLMLSVFFRVGRDVTLFGYLVPPAPATPPRRGTGTLMWVN